MVSFCIGIETEDVAICLHFAYNFWLTCFLFSIAACICTYTCKYVSKFQMHHIKHFKTAPSDDNFAFYKTAQKKSKHKMTQWILKQKRMFVENRDSEIEDSSKTATTTRKPKFILDA